MDGEPDASRQAKLAEAGTHASDQAFFDSQLAPGERRSEGLSIPEARLRAARRLPVQDFKGPGPGRRAPSLLASGGCQCATVNTPCRGSSRSMLRPRRLDHVLKVPLRMKRHGASQLRVASRLTIGCAKPGPECEGGSAPRAACPRRRRPARGPPDGSGFARRRCAQARAEEEQTGPVCARLMLLLLDMFQA